MYHQKAIYWDDGDVLNIVRADSKKVGSILRPDFGGFKVKMVEIVLATEGAVHLQSEE